MSTARTGETHYSKVWKRKYCTDNGMMYSPLDWFCTPKCIDTPTLLPIQDAISSIPIDHCTKYYKNFTMVIYELQQFRLVQIVFGVDFSAHFIWPRPRNSYYALWWLILRYVKLIHCNIWSSSTEKRTCEHLQHELN